jgi:hypothetical protein
MSTSNADSLLTNLDSQSNTTINFPNLNNSEPLPSQNDLLSRFIESLHLTSALTSISSQPSSQQHEQLLQAMCLVTQNMARRHFNLEMPPSTWLTQDFQPIPQVGAIVPFPSPPVSPMGRAITEREQFLLFIKILLKFIEQAGNPRLRQHAKAVVGECTRRNRMGDMDYVPLQDAVEMRLRNVVGDITWTRAKLYVDHYVAKRGIRLHAASN